MTISLGRRLVAEALGTMLLFATVVGAGIMAVNLSGGNNGVALIGTTIPIAAILVVIIVIFGPVSGAHFNPVVTLVVRLDGGITTRDALAYVAVQFASGAAAILITHLMFGLPPIQIGSVARTGPGQWLSEAIATFALVMTILGTGRFRPDIGPYAVALVILAACWFTASTSFANPAITFARSLTDTFCAIRPADVPMFIAAQIVGALSARSLGHWLFGREPAAAS
ncbi:MIP/aquaporin family protein [Sandarakinorhabdus sp.]|uniref:MIP/aquaporin family protein n=1 Tax=Sandarakinorhabdus sp. TaxID=1916663 RepID=UPI00286DBCAE|nr:MIP/aquaporin family protein [Sandarakinorhabdus sp.]